MTLPAAADWIFGAIGVACVLWTLVRSVHVKVKFRVRKLTPDDSEPALGAGPKFSFQKAIRVEHGKPIHFGTRTGIPN
jgi:hypothetical protein